MKSEKQTITNKLGQKQFGHITSVWQCKSWRRAERKCQERQQIRNYSVEMAYKAVLKLVKKKTEELPPKERSFYESDLREDMDNLFSMHSFITPTLYWHLECDLSLRYIIEYNFYNYPFEQEIWELSKGFYSLEGRLVQRDLKPNCEAYFHSVLKVQGGRHFGSLEVK